MKKLAALGLALTMEWSRDRDCQSEWKPEGEWEREEFLWFRARANICSGESGSLNNFTNFKIPNSIEFITSCAGARAKCYHTFFIRPSRVGQTWLAPVRIWRWIFPTRNEYPLYTMRMYTRTNRVISLSRCRALGVHSANHQANAEGKSHFAKTGRKIGGQNCGRAIRFN